MIKGIYTARQCTDVNDCQIAIKTLLERIRLSNGIYTKEEQKRYASLVKRMNKLSK